MMSVFDAIAAVNRLGQIAKERVEKLHHSLLATQQSQLAHQAFDFAGSVTFVPTGNIPNTSAATLVGGIAESIPSLGNPFFDEWTLPDGLSGEQMMSLADALAEEDLGGMFQ